MLTWLTGVSGYYLPLYVVLLILLISLPSMILAWLKLRQRNLGPLLDANGWAVNARAKINIPFGGSLTAVAKLPPGSQRDLMDPYAEKTAGRIWTIAAIVVILAAASCWYFGCFQKYLPDWLPRSSFVLSREKAIADRLLAQAAVDITTGKLDAATQALKELDTLQPRLPPEYITKIADLRKSFAAAQSSPATIPATTQAIPK